MVKLPVENQISLQAGLAAVAKVRFVAHKRSLSCFMVTIMTAATKNTGSPARKCRATNKCC